MFSNGKTRRGQEGRGGGTVPVCRNPKCSPSPLKRSSEVDATADFLFPPPPPFLDHNPGSVRGQKESEALARASAVLSVL